MLQAKMSTGGDGFAWAGWLFGRVLRRACRGRIAADGAVMHYRRRKRPVVKSLSVTAGSCAGSTAFDDGSLASPVSCAPHMTTEGACRTGKHAMSLAKMPRMLRVGCLVALIDEQSYKRLCQAEAVRHRAKLSNRSQAHSQKDVKGRQFSRHRAMFRNVTQSKSRTQHMVVLKWSSLTHTRRFTGVRGVVPKGILTETGIMVRQVRCMADVLVQPCGRTELVSTMARPT